MGGQSCVLCSSLTACMCPDACVLMLRVATPFPMSALLKHVGKHDKMHQGLLGCTAADDKPFSFEAALQSHVGTHEVRLMEATGFEGKLMLNSDASPDRPLLRLSDEDSATYGGEHLASLATLLRCPCSAGAADQLWDLEPPRTQQPSWLRCQECQYWRTASCEGFQVLASMPTVE